MSVVDAVIRNLFNQLDLDGDGFLTPQEFQTYFAQIGIPVNKFFLRVIYASFDTNQDGLISFPEFYETVTGQPYTGAIFMVQAALAANSNPPQKAHAPNFPIQGPSRPLGTTIIATKPSPQPTTVANEWIVQDGQWGAQGGNKTQASTQGAQWGVQSQDNLGARNMSQSTLPRANRW